MTFRLLALGLAMALTGCQATTWPAAQQGAMVSHVGTGHHQLSVRVASARFETLATAHRWEADDVYQYEIALQVQDGDGPFVDLTPPQRLILAQKGSETSTTAVFSAVAAGKIYQASVTAKGNRGGTAPDLALNSTPATVTFDLRSATAAQERQATVVFDPIDFAASQELGVVDPPGDGQFLEPAEPESVSTSTPTP